VMRDQHLAQLASLHSKGYDQSDSRSGEDSGHVANSQSALRIFVGAKI